MSRSGSSSGTGQLSAGGGSHWLRWMVLIAIAIGAIVAGRKIALNSADKDFEERLRELDAERG